MQELEASTLKIELKREVDFSIEVLGYNLKRSLTLVQLIMILVVE